MRHHPTPPEAALWRQLSGRRLDGIAFKRQVPIGPFIADFLAPRHRLIVEVDGAHHTQRVTADARRDGKLRRWGYRVLRLDAELVLRDTPEVLRRVREALG
jgi:very-short-patch-repair endonuclease